MKLSMKILAVVAIVLLTASGCSKGGCTDKTALNYDPKAKWNDHSCKYFINAYLGTYIGIDSATYNVNDSSVKLVTNNRFTIVAFGTNALTLENFPFYIHNFKVDTNPQSFIDTSDSGQYPIIGTIYLKNDTFYYNMRLLADTPIVQSHQGFGIKQ